MNEVKEENRDVKAEDTSNEVLGEKKERKEDDSATHQEEKKSKSNEIEKILENIFGTTVDVGDVNHVTLIQNLNYVDKNSGIVMGDHAEVEDIIIQSEKKNNDMSDVTLIKGSIVENRAVLARWLNEHYNDFEMAFLVSLAVFEKSPYLWVYELAEDLFDMMEGDKKEKRKEKERIPGNQRIEVMGGRTYFDCIYDHTGQVECEFIRFQESKYAHQVLECVWKEFIFFRETLINWLEKYVFDKNCTKMVKAINALSILAVLDFYYFDKNVIRLFFDRKDFRADFAVAKIMLQVYENERYRNNVETQFKHWARLGSLHYCLVALQMCVGAEWKQEKVQMAVENYIDKLEENLSCNSRREYEEALVIFFSIGVRKSVYYKTIVTVLYDKMILYNDRKQRYKRKLIGLIFFMLLNIDFKTSNVDVNYKRKNKDMIFVKMCLIKNDITPKLLELWKYIWKSREFHRETEKFLKLYLYQYGGCTQDDINYLRQFLYSFQDTEAERNNMEFFLKKISLKSKTPVRTAERINNS